MADKSADELLGSNDKAVKLGPKPVETEVKLAPKALSDFAATYTPDAIARDKPGEPDRLFLKLRNITGNQGACIFDVAISVPGGSKPWATVGSMALFGLEYASSNKSEHGGGGLNKTFEISEEIDPQLQALRRAEKIRVNISPRGTFGTRDHVTIEKIDVYRLRTS
jgi:hypothetical protein